jgi:hypothetical protein
MGLFGAANKGGFNWGNALLGFFGGPDVLQMLAARRQAEAAQQAQPGLQAAAGRTGALLADGSHGAGIGHPPADFEAIKAASLAGGRGGVGVSPAAPFAPGARFAMRGSGGFGDIGLAPQQASFASFGQEGYHRNLENSEAYESGRQQDRDPHDILRERRLLPTLGDEPAPQRAPAIRAQSPASQTRTTPQRAGPALGVLGDQVGEPRLGSLSEREESGGGGPGTISTGQGDPGGVSYGTWQLSTNEGMVQAFLGSPFAHRWARDFQGLTPATAPFNGAWRRVAAREPEVFEDAQYQFLREQNYGYLARRMRREVGLDLDQLSRTVREVAWSTSAQHGTASRFDIFRNAAREADRLVGRGNAGYDEVLIRQVYAERIRRAIQRRNTYAARRTPGQRRRWEMFNNIATIRFPRELNDALQMLQQEGR